jgi:S-adenosylmethionine/arginine decarboxylase-like enzyme
MHQCERFLVNQKYMSILSKVVLIIKITIAAIDLFKFGIAGLSVLIFV